MSERDDLRKLIRDLAIVRGRVVLSSGAAADSYVDLRRLTLHHAGAPLVGRVMLDLVDGWDFDAVGGMTLGADPVALAMLHEGNQRGRALDAFVVRKEEKAHGMRRRIEGPDVAGRRVLVVEDTSTTGSTPLTAVRALGQAGAEVVGVAVIVDRGASDAVRATGVDFRSVYAFADLDPHA
jgi:orotate phosphoribosyltransferase